MADFITNTLPTWYKEDVTNYFLQPLFRDPSVLRIFDVRSNIKSSERMTKFSAVEKITKAHAPGWNPSAGATQTTRDLVVKRVQAEIEQDANKFFDTVMGELLRSGTSKNDLTGTQLQAIIADLYLKSVQRDFNRQIWFGDTASLSADYNAYDGIFKILAGLPAGQKLVFPAGAIGVDGAVAEFEKVKAAAPSELLENRQDTVLIVSRSVADNYRESLRSGSTEQAFMNLQDGVNTLRWDGFEVIEMAQWDSHIAADGLATDPHRIVMTHKQNIVIGTDFEQATVENWYERKDKLNMFRFEYVTGVQYRNDELTVTDIAA